MPVYLIHFEERYRHAGHYIGFTKDLEQRIRAHREGRGARLMQVVNEAGIGWEVVRVWEGGRDLERAFKALHNAPRLCPICQQQAVAWTLEQQPWGEQDEGLW